MESIKHIQKKAGLLRQKTKSLLLYAFMTTIATAMAAHTRAQTFAEWFDQKSTQKKYLYQQIAAFQLYAGYLKKGYTIASHGLGDISGYLKTENSLHSIYYDRLEKAGPLVRNNQQVRDILQWQQDIITRLHDLDQIKGLTSEETEYLDRVGSAVLKDCGQQLEDLQQVVSDNSLKMSDQERLSAIARVHTAMQQNYRFVSGFGDQAGLIAAQRRRAGRDFKMVQPLYGFN